MTQDARGEDKDEDAIRHCGENRRTDKRRGKERASDSRRRVGGDRRQLDEGEQGREPSTEHTFERIAVIRNKRGLHARAAAKFVTEAGKFDAMTTVKRGDMSVSGNSIMGLMMLAAGPSCDIEIITSGTDALKALKALCDLVEAKFGED